MSYWKFTSLSLLIASSIACAETIPAESAQKNGIKTCLPAIKKFSAFLIGEGTNYGSNSTWGSNDPDKKMFVSQIEKTHKNGDPELITMYVAPTTSGLCGAAYERVSYWPNTCMKVAKETFASFEYKGELNESITHLTKDGNPLFLMKAGNGCITIKQEIVYDLNNP